MNAMTLVVHIVAGTLGLLTGFVALYAAKGARLHRKSGMAFVSTMIVMALVGAVIAVVRNKWPEGNVPVAFLTAYLVITALTTVRARDARSRRLDVALAVMASTIALTFATFAAVAITSPNGKLNGFPSTPFFIFGGITLMALIGDVRMIRSGGSRAIRGGPRLARHLWRMCTALLIAALSASVQFGKLIPKSYRVPGMLTLPLLAIVVTMAYWLWRVRVKQSLRGIVGVTERRVASATLAGD